MRFVRFVRLLTGVSAVALLTFVGAAVASSPGSPLTLSPRAMNCDAGFTVPWDVLISKDAKRVYVSDRDGGLEALHAPNLCGYSPQPITDAGAKVTYATGLALSPNDKTLYVAGQVNGTPGIYIADVSGSGSDVNDDTIIGKVGDPNGLVDNPVGLAIAPNGRRLYIGNAAAGSAAGSASIAVADLTAAGTWTIEKSYPEPNLWDTTEFAWNPDHKLLYAANLSGPVDVLQISGNDVKFDKSLAGTDGIYGIAVTPDGHTMYGSVLSKSLSDTGDSASSLIDTFALTDGGTSAKALRKQALPSNSTMTGLSIGLSGKEGFAGWFGDSTAGDASTASGGVMKFALPLAMTKLSILGKDKVGSELTAQPTSPAAMTVTFHWSANNRAIKGADKRSLKITKKLEGKDLAVTATAVGGGYSQVTLKTRWPDQFTLESGSKGLIAGLSCAHGTSTCVAIDGLGRETTFNPQDAEHYDQHVVDRRALSASRGYTTAVSCPTKTQCTVVDDSGREVTFNPQKPGQPHAVRIDQDEGGPAHENAQLLGISCPSNNQCTAFGGNGDEYTFDPLVPKRRTHGLVDKAVAVGHNPTVTGVKSELFSAISCPTTTFCEASDTTAVVRFNPEHPSGSKRHLMVNWPFGLSCPTAKQCTVSESTDDNTSEAVTFNPRSPAHAHLDDFSGLLSQVSCPTAKRCSLVGFNTDYYESYISPFEISFNPHANVERARHNFGETAHGRDEDQVRMSFVDCPTAKVCVGINWAGRAISWPLLFWEQ